MFTTDNPVASVKIFNEKCDVFQSPKNGLFGVAFPGGGMVMRPTQASTIEEAIFKAENWRAQAWAEGKRRAEEILAKAVMG